MWLAPSRAISHDSSALRAAAAMVEMMSRRFRHHSCLGQTRQSSQGEPRHWVLFLVSTITGCPAAGEESHGIRPGSRCTGCAASGIPLLGGELRQRPAAQGNMMNVEKESHGD